jgi:hypothetical protein
MKNQRNKCCPLLQGKFEDDQHKEEAGVVRM